MAEKTEQGVGSKEQTRFLANRVESRIVDGVTELLGEPERLWLAGLMEERGVNFKVLKSYEIRVGEMAIKAESCETGKGVGTLTAQTAFVEAALGGREKMAGAIQAMMEMTLKGERKEEARGFVTRYLAEHDKDGLVGYGTEGDLLKIRLEAFVSATHRLLVILAQDNEGKAFEHQNDKYVLKFLRERVMRGWEKKKTKETDKSVVTLSPVIKRSDEKIIRSLPIGGVEAIFEALLA